MSVFLPVCRELEMEFESPFRELGFNGVPHRSTAFVMPTVNCLVRPSRVQRAPRFGARQWHAVAWAASLAPFHYPATDLDGGKRPVGTMTAFKPGDQRPMPVADAN